MSTRYTAAVADGEVTDFATFALSCARAFGALAIMRDDPPDAPIPEFTVSERYAEQVEEAKRHLADVEAWSSKGAEAVQARRREMAAQGAREFEARRVETEARYRAMLAKVEAWTPPTDEHVGMKKFMREQLEESIRFDCTPYEPKVPEPLDPLAYKQQQVEEARRRLADRELYLQEEVDRSASRNAWMRALRESLSAQAVTA